jgi:hypothetical protein
MIRVKYFLFLQPSKWPYMKQLTLDYEATCVNVVSNPKQKIEKIIAD